jgi:hypothetical protein
MLAEVGQMAKKTRKRVAKDKSNVVIYDVPLPAKDKSNVVIYDVPLPTKHYPLMRLSDVARELSADTLRDGKYKNVDGSAGACRRCNRGVTKNAIFFKRDGHVFGPECIAFYNAVRAIVTDGEEAARIIEHQFRLRMRYLTIAGMERKKLLTAQKAKPAPIAEAATPSEVAAQVRPIQLQLEHIKDRIEHLRTPDGQLALA